MNERDIKMISTRKVWPHWPWLPLKRWGESGVECAVLHADEGMPPQRPVKLYKDFQLARKFFFPTPTMPVAQEFPNWDAFLASDWRID